MNLRKRTFQQQHATHPANVDGGDPIEDSFRIADPYVAVLDPFCAQVVTIEESRPDCDVAARPEACLNVDLDLSVGPRDVVDGLYVSRMASDTIAAQEDDELDSGGFEGCDGGFHVIRRSMDEVEEGALGARFGDGAGDGVRLVEIGLHSLEAACFLLLRAEIWDGLVRVAQGQIALGASLLRRDGGRTADLARGTEDDHFHSRRHGRVGFLSAAHKIPREPRCLYRRNPAYKSAGRVNVLRR